MNAEKLERCLTRDWGERCKDYSTGCYVCSVWHAYDILVTAYDTKKALHKQEWMKSKDQHIHNWRECYPILGERYEWCDTKGCGIWRGGKSPWEATQQPQERNI